MPDYAAMCRRLPGAQADAIDELGRITQSLIRTHRLAEEVYVNAFGPDRMALEHEDGRPEDLPRQGRNKRRQTLMALAAFLEYAAYIPAARFAGPPANSVRLPSGRAFGLSQGCCLLAVRFLKKAATSSC